MKQKRELKKNKQKRVKYNIDVYDIEVHILINYTDDLLNKLYTRLDGLPLNSDALADNSKGTVWGILKDSKTGKKVVIVNINLLENIDKYDLINTIGHEALHAACYILEYVNIQLSRQSEEAFAYLTGYINERIYKTVFDK